MKNAKLTLPIAVSAALLVWPIHFAAARQEGSGTDLKSDAIGTTVIESGLLVPAKSRPVRNETGRALHILYAASPGEVVEKGDIVVELEALPLFQAQEDSEQVAKEAAFEMELARDSVKSSKRESAEVLTVAELTLELAERRLEAFKEGEYPAELAARESKVNIAEEMLKLTEGELRRISSQPEGAQTNPMIDEARLAVTRARTDLDQARTELQLLKTFIYPLRQAELELDVATGRLELMRVKGKVERAVRQSEMQLKLSEPRRRTALGRLQLVQKQLEGCKWHAPESAIVLGPAGPGDHTPAKPGQLAEPGETILRLGTLDTFELHVPVDLEVAQRITVDQKATIRFDALPDQVFAGQVAEVRTGVVHTPSPWHAIVRLDETPDHLKPGMTAQVHIRARD